MPKSKAIVQTRSASRYMTRLCKHWAHRFDVKYDENSGCIQFGDGERCLLNAFSDSLGMTVHAASYDALESLEKVVVDHLMRMANDDKPSEAVWQRADC